MMDRLSELTKWSASLVAVVATSFSMSVLAQSSSSAGQPANQKTTKPASTQKAAPASTAPRASAQQEQEADQIVAVVNKDVITQRELDKRVLQAKSEMRLQKVAPPPDSVIQQQILDRMITERLELQEAERQKISVNDEMLKMALDSIAARNKMKIDQLRKQVESSGVTWKDYLDIIRREILMDRLRQRVIDSTILVTDAEVDAFLKEQKARQSGGIAALGRPAAQPAQEQAAPPPAAASGPEILGLAQILVRVPEGASKEQVEELRKRAQSILARIKKGERFPDVAAAMSDGAESNRGGDMGARPVDGWPELFIKAVSGLGQGQVSNIVQSGNGFHILLVTGRAGGAQQARQAQRPQQPQQAQAPQPAPGGPVIAEPKGPMMVNQTKVRHILIKTSTVMSDESARQRLEVIRQRIQNGESFQDMAKRFSNDSSAPQGGELGWINPGETVPPFEKAMNALQVGEVSQPVQSPFGWHLILVEERRSQDMADQFRRNQVRQLLFERRSRDAFDSWLQSLRSSSYIDNRLEKRQRQAQQ